MTAMIAQAQPVLKRTPLNNLHVTMGARMAPFAGYEMPIQYPAGVMKEHLHTRAAASLFDVSHMGQIALRPSGGTPADIALALERLVPADVLGLAPGRQRYVYFTNAHGGIIDDLMITACGDHVALVVNASRKEVDEAHLRAAMSPVCTMEVLDDRALLALQGPKAEEALARLAPEVASMRFMDARMLAVGGSACLVTRSGYTGEDGFEISMPADIATALWDTLLRDKMVAPIGLGARDTLRLEAGLCLYGSDLAPDITPVEAALEWTIPAGRRVGGARAGGFLGADVILGQLAEGAPRRRIGLKPQGRAPVRGGAPLFLAEHDAVPAGAVTSGGFGVTLDAPIAMGYVTCAAAAPGRRLFAEVRGRRLDVAVCELPFVASHYRR
jgi:aminomethyltransferase